MEEERRHNTQQEEGDLEVESLTNSLAEQGTANTSDRGPPFIIVTRSNTADEIFSDDPEEKELRPKSLMCLECAEQGDFHHWSRRCGNGRSCISRPISSSRLSNLVLDADIVESVLSGPTESSNATQATRLCLDLGDNEASHDTQTEGTKPDSEESHEESPPSLEEDSRSSSPTFSDPDNIHLSDFYSDDGNDLGDLNIKFHRRVKSESNKYEALAEREFVEGLERKTGELESEIETLHAEHSKCLQFYKKSFYESTNVEQAWQYWREVLDSMYTKMQQQTAKAEEFEKKADALRKHRNHFLGFYEIETSDLLDDSEEGYRRLLGSSSDFIYRYYQCEKDCKALQQQNRALLANFRDHISNPSEDKRTIKELTKKSWDDKEIINFYKTNYSKIKTHVDALRKNCKRLNPGDSASKEIEIGELPCATNTLAEMRDRHEITIERLTEEVTSLTGEVDFLKTIIKARHKENKRLIKSADKVQRDTVKNELKLTENLRNVRKQVEEYSRQIAGIVRDKLPNPRENVFSRSQSPPETTELERENKKLQSLFYNETSPNAELSKLSDELEKQIKALTSKNTKFSRRRNELSQDGLRQIAFSDVSQSLPPRRSQVGDARASWNRKHRPAEAEGRARMEAHFVKLRRTVSDYFVARPSDTGGVVVDQTLEELQAGHEGTMPLTLTATAGATERIASCQRESDELKHKMAEAREEVDKELERVLAMLEKVRLGQWWPM